MLFARMPEQGVVAALGTCTPREALIRRAEKRRQLSRERAAQSSNRGPPFLQQRTPA